jgi:hypothetical protein
VISAHPQSATYFPNAQAAALSVTASSPDGGVLSYQWHRSTGGAWTAIEGAAESSYMPPISAVGIVSYYVKVTNTNAAASGAKTATASSNLATVTATVVHAQAPVISAHPQSATYFPNAQAAALSVTASSPDGGELSYQWHKRTGSNDEWAAIEGATESSYTPPTGTLGRIYYYALVVNTNNSASGYKTALVNSEFATVIVTSSGASSLVIKKWANGGYTLINNMPEYLDIAPGESLIFTAAEDLTNLRWSINNNPIAAPAGIAQSIAIEGASYSPGNHTLGLYAEKDGVPYSINITFTVVNN